MLMLKRYFYFLASLILLFTFYACTKNEHDVAKEDSEQTDPPAEPIVINAPTGSIYPGDSYQLSYRLAAPLTDLKWQSSDTDIATVSADGLVSTKLPGDVLITLSSASAKYEASVQVRVILVKLEAIAWENPADTFIVAVLYEPKQLNIKFIPENAFDKWLSWRSSDERRTVVDENGVLTAKNVGYSFIEVSQGTSIYQSAHILPGIRELGIPVSFYYSYGETDDETVYWLNFNAGAIDLPIHVTKLELYTYIANSGIPIALKKEEEMDIRIAPDTGRSLWRLALTKEEYDIYMRGSLVRVYYTVNNEKNEVFDVLW